MILSNQVHCHNCDEKPWSGHVHDFVQCGCVTASERVCVDGGQEYLRRVSGPAADYTDISITMDEAHVTGLKDELSDPERNELGKLCNVVRYLRDEMGINVTQEGDQ
jgi:hypothetical protein